MYTAKNLMKKMVSGILVLVILAGVVFVPDTQARAASVNFETGTMPIISNMDQINTAPAIYTTHVSAGEEYSNEAVLSYFQFSIEQESWVYLEGSMSNNNHNGGRIHVDLYSDAAMAHKIGEYGWGYYEYDKEFMAFLQTGTYYGRISAKHANYEYPYVSDLNVVGGAIPTSVLFDTKVTVSANGKKATVSIPDAMREQAQDVQYRVGKVSKTYNTSQKYWKYPLMGSYYGPNDAYRLTVEDDQYSFTVKKNGYYTIRIKDAEDNCYSKVVKVSGIGGSSAAITVSGVKNGKTYKKAVTIKFSSTGGAIKSATLNGKKIASGTKVSARGSYTLKVTDQAGNKKTIKFKLK
jgi:hypothetical protein